MIILNPPLNIDDSIKIKIENNTQENYLFYFQQNRFSYFQNSKNTPIALIYHNMKLADVSNSSHPFFIPDDNGSYSEEDLQMMEEIIKKTNERLVKVVRAKKSIVFKIKFIDSLNQYLTKSYPILEEGKTYKVGLKIKMDSTSLLDKDIEKINKMLKNKDVKLFQGELFSNPVRVINGKTIYNYIDSDHFK